MTRAMLPELFEELRKESARPDVGVLVSALKTCARSRNAEYGVRIHNFVLESGHVSNVYVANTLVDMYAKCGMLEESRSVFETMQKRDVVSWNCIISGYAANGEGDTALELFYRMTHEGTPVPDKITLLSAIKACALLAEKETGLNIGRFLHSEAARCGCELHIRVACTLVTMYSKCGSMQDAWNVFLKISRPDVAAWTSLILGYVANGDGRRAIELYEKMTEDKRIEPDAVAYVAVFQACAAVGEQESPAGKKLWWLEKGKQFHAQAAELGYESNTFVVNALVDMYSKCRCIEIARKVFEKVACPDAVTWNSIIMGYAENGEGNEALELFERMQKQGVAASDVTYLGVLKACTVLAEKEMGQLVDGKIIKAAALDKGRSFHLRARKNGELQTRVASALVDMYAKCGSMVDAREVFESIKQRDLVSWNCIICGYAQCGENEGALVFYEKMQEIGFKPDPITYVGALKACAGLADQEQGKSVDGKLIKLDCLQRGRSIQAQIVAAGFERNKFVATCLVDMYGRCGSISEARNVFERLAHRDDVSCWNCIILRCAVAGEGEVAVEYFSRMKEQGCAADGLTYVAGLKAFACVADLDSGLKLHREIKDAGFEGDPLVSTTLVDFYGKCGLMGEAKAAFDGIAHRDVVAWNALLAGYCRQGDVSRAFALFQQMLDTNMQPDEIMVLSLLAACSHSGLVQLGRDCFEAMVSRFKLKPSVDHYSCMVDLLGRANILDEALAMARSTSVEANTVIWMSLLSACCRWKNLEIGRVAFEEIVKIDRGYPAAYVIMSNLYALVGMEDESSTTIQSLKDPSKPSIQNAEKSCWTDCSSGVHTFS